jgi:sugar/nucleoside kinase (ribokinase family)
MTKVITLGETLVEIMRPVAGQPLDQTGEFIGPFASGAPAIFAVASTRLGLPTAFIGAVGNDAFGRLLRTRLSMEGVDTSGLHTLPTYSTAVAFVAYEVTGGRDFVFHLHHSASSLLNLGSMTETFFEGVAWLHLSGSTIFINENSRAVCWQALKRTKNAGGKFSLDPNLRPELMPVKEAREVLAPFISAADLLLPTSTEAFALTGKSDIDSAIKALNAKSDSIIVIKNGSDGCSIYNKYERIDVASFPVEEIDPTGAGDCFSAAFVAGLEFNWPLQKIGRFANAAGALAVTKMGPMEGAPTRKEVEDFYA